MKKICEIAIACLFMVCMLVPALAEDEWSFFEQSDFLKQYSVEELLLLRELIDEELASRENQGISMETYVLNMNTRKFHSPSCESVPKIKENNKKEFIGSREDLISTGYSPCGNCHP